MVRNHQVYLLLLKSPFRFGGSVTQIRSSGVRMVFLCIRAAHRQAPARGRRGEAGQDAQRQGEPHVAMVVKTTWCHFAG